MSYQLRDRAQDDERQIQAALRARAAFPVDTARDWPRVATRLRLTPTGAASSLAHGAGRGWLVRGWERSRPRTWQGVAALALTVVALTGMGYGAIAWAGPFIGQKLGLINQGSLFTTVNQSRSDAGMVVWVDKAYADPGNTYIAFRIQPAHVSAGTLIPLTYELTDQYGEQSGPSDMQCTARSDANAPEVCMLDVAPFHPPAGATSLTLAWDIMAIGGPGANGANVRVAGDWRFTFTIPFHTKNLGSGGPYAVPTHGATGP